MTKRYEPWSRRTRALSRAIERDNVIGSGTVDRIKASGRVRPRYQAGHMTAPSRIEINQIALDPCGASTHDNAVWQRPAVAGRRATDAAATAAVRRA